MKKLLLSLILMALSLPAWAGDTKESAFDRVMRTGTLKCGVFPWPPYFEIDANTQKIVGKAKPFYDTAASLLNIKIEYVDVNFATYIEDMKLGRIDAFCNDGPYTTSFAKQVNYVTPWFYAPVFLYGRKNERVTKDKESFNRADFRFTGIDGDLSIDLKNKLFPKATLVAASGMSDYSLLLMDIVGHKADAMILDVPSYDKFNKNNPEKITLLYKKPLAVYPVGFSVLKSEQQLWQTLNTATEMAINMGVADKVLHDIDPTGKALYPTAKKYEAKE